MEESVSRIAARPGVLGVVVATLDKGALISHTGDVEEEAARRYALHVSKLMRVAQEETAQELAGELSGESVSFFTLRTASHDLLVSLSEEYVLITLRDPKVKQ